MIKIVFIINGLNNGGAEAMLIKVLQHIDLNQFEPHVISLRDIGTKGNEITALNIPLHCLNMPKGRPSLSGITKLKKIIREIAPDIIQGWSYHANFAASWVAHKLEKTLSKSPKIIWNIRQTLYDLEQEKFTTRLMIYALKRSYQSASRIVYNSECSAYHHEKIGFPANKRILIPNAFDTNHYAPNPEAREQWRKIWQLEDDALVVTMCANFLPMKDYATFLQAVGQLLPRHRNLHIVLVGEGISHQNVEFVKLLPLGMSNQRLHLQGEQQDMAGIYAASDVFVLSSAWGEAFSNTIGEAMSCGLTGVVTDVGDAKAIVGDTMRVVPPVQPILLADAIHQILIAQPSERIQAGLAARERVLQAYSVNKIILQYQALYQSLAT